jgi:hypothetical protein
MKVQLGEIYGARDSLAKLLALTCFEAKISILIARLARKLGEEIKTIEQQRLQLVQKYGEKDGENNQLVVTPENREAFIKEFDEALDQTIEIDMPQVVIPGNIVIEPSILLALDKFITVE